MQSLTGTGKSSSPQTPRAAPERRPWHVPLPPLVSKARQHPTPYHKNLTPLPSPLRPHCPASQRLCLWHPLVPRAQRTSQYTDEDLERIEAVMARAWEDDTHTTYASGLLNFMVFCDMKEIPEVERAPAGHILLLSFILTLAAAYLGLAISNYLYGVRAWHILHGVLWKIERMEMDTMLKAAEKLTPPSSKCKKRRPYTVDFILAIRQHLDLQKPLDASVFACLSTCFFATGRVSEFTVPKLDGFNPEAHVPKVGVSYDQSRDGQQVTVLHIPRTKVAPQGEDVCWAKQDGLVDPDAALVHHIEINAPPDDAHLFAYRYNTGHRPLTKSKFISELAKATHAAGLEPLQGHGIRIGSTLEYLLRGIPFDVMKVKGCWSSDTFILYLRKHVQILAPYIQAAPAVHDAFTCLMMPAVW